MQAMVREARDRAAFAGAEVEAMSLAALRATTYADWLESQFNAGPSQGR